jgi:hypothetical protein
VLWGKSPEGVRSYDCYVVLSHVFRMFLMYFFCPPYRVRIPLRAFGGHKHVEQRWGAGLPGILTFSAGVERWWGAGLFIIWLFILRRPLRAEESPL